MREADDTAYWYDGEDGQTASAPINIDGTIDFVCTSYIDDFDICLSAEVLEEIQANLKE